MNKSTVEQLNQSHSHNLEAEQIVLGACLISDEARKQVLSILKEKSDFYEARHQILFKSYLEMNNEQVPVDVFSSFSYLKDKGYLSETLNSSYLTYLTELVPSTENITYYAKLVQEKAAERRLCEVFTRLNIGLRSKSIRYDKAIEEIKMFLAKEENSTSSFLQLMSWQELIGKEEPPSDFLIEDLLPAGTLALLVGKPKLGKSLLALYFAASVALGQNFWGKKVRKGNVLFISTEDGATRIRSRLWKMLDSPDKSQPLLYLGHDYHSV